MTTIQHFRLAAAAACTLLVSVTCEAGDDELIRVNESSIAHGFALTDIERLDHRLGDYKDQVVLITFWASWCPLCLWEMPALEQLWKGLGGDGLVLLAIEVHVSSGPGQWAAASWEASGGDRNDSRTTGNRAHGKRT